MSQGRIASLLVAFCGLAVLALPSVSAARTAYITGSAEEGNPYAAPVDLVTETTGSLTTFSGEGAPPAVAISPDGLTAYVAAEAFDGQKFVGELAPINVASNTAGTPIVLGEGSPWGIAITPDGSRAYVTDRSNGTVAPVNLAAGTAGTPIPVSGEPLGIAITPDGSRAYVAIGSEKKVVPIDLSTNTALPAIEVGQGPTAVAVSPNGAGVYVTNRASKTVSRIDPATDTVTKTIPVEENPEAIAITPDSSRAYVLGFNSPVTPIDLATGTAGSAIGTGGHFLNDLAILPDGSRAYVTDESSNELDPLDIPANTFGASFGTEENPDAIAIVPDQPPRASFTVSPSETAPGAKVAFDASASADTDGGSVARYDWDFGDGTALADGGKAPSHSFAKSGTYTVALTTTDNEGCSTQIVFPGQTAFCNGSSIARTTRTVKVIAPCPAATATATSFVPVFRAAHIVPGVRVRLAAGVPSHLVVSATLEWSNDGSSHRTELSKRSVDVKHWRRIRYPIPSKVRGELPLGSPVTLKLKIVATPLEGDACVGSTTEKTLHLKVVKVIPSAEQHGRRR